MVTKKTKSTRRAGASGRKSTRRPTAPTNSLGRKASRSEQDVCAHCNCYRSAHYAVNFADGPMVSGTTLLCPTSVFLRG